MTGKNHVLAMAAATAVLALFFLAVSCATLPAPGPPPPPDIEERLAEAETLLERGAYVTIREAARIYAEAYAVPEFRGRTAAPFFKSLLLLSLREGEMGMKGFRSFEAARRIFEANPSLAGYRPYLEMAWLVPKNTRGIITEIDIVPQFTTGFQQARERILAMEEDLAVRAFKDEFLGYVFTAWKCSQGIFVERRIDPASYVRAFPGSMLLLYRNAVCGGEDPEALKDILARESDFFEAHYHLGQEALRRGAVLETESHLLRAFEGIPESPQTRILLAALYFATEEFEKSLEFYDLTLDIEPGYRDALLGKAVCLSAMEKHEAAIAVLEKNLEMGFYLVGESHYWIAWNFSALKEPEKAVAHIQESKGRLPTNTEVFGLSGRLNLELGHLDKAAADFLEALQYGPGNTDALFGLGNLRAQERAWLESAGWFAKAAGATENGLQAARARLSEIESAPLAEGRKTRMRIKQQDRIRKLDEALAGAWYGAAAGYANAGDAAEAISAAEKAAVHPAFKDRAEALAAKLLK